MARHVLHQGLEVQQGTVLYGLLTSKDEKERAKAPGHLKDVLQRHDKLAGLTKASGSPVAASKLDGKGYATPAAPGTPAAVKNACDVVLGLPPPPPTFS
jgi:hypothetical protein